MATERSVLVRLKANTGDFVAGMTTAQAAVRGLTKEIDTSNDRTAWLAQSILALGPALVPLGAAAAPILAGVTMQLGLTAAAAGTAALAFNGIGDALKSVNDYQLEPTAENFQKMQVELEKIGPAGAEFVKFLDDVAPKFAELQMAAREGMFPGVEEGITSFLDVMPKVRNIVSEIAEAMGQLAAEAGEGLSGKGFATFFNYLESDAKPLLVEMGQTVGNFIEGFANMVVAFDPLTQDFSSGFLDMSRAFSDWSHGLDESQSFQEFVSYVQGVIPQVKDTLGALTDAFIGLLEAAAPVGGVTLHVLEGLFNVLSAIFRSPAGPALLGAAAGIAAVSRAVALYKLANGSALMALLTKGGGEGAKAALGFRGAAAGLGMLALSLTDMDDKAGVTNTTMFAMMGMVGGPWGAAIGGAVGATLDFTSANDDLATAIEAADRAMASSVGLGTLKQKYADVKTELDAVIAAQHEMLYGRESSGENLFERIGGDIKTTFTGIGGYITDATDEGQDALSHLRVEMGSTGDASDLFGETIGLTGRKVRAAAGDVRALSAQLAGLSGWLDKREALRNYADSVSALRKSLEKGFSREMVENLDSVGRGIIQVVENLKGPAKARFIDSSIASLEKLAENAGPKAAAEVEKLIRRLEKLDNTSAEPDVGANTKPAKDKLTEADRMLRRWENSRGEADVTVDGRQALSTLFNIDHMLDNLKSKTLYITTVERRVGAGGQANGYDPSAYGNIFPSVRYNAHGDIANGHQPELAGPGVTRVWREPETQGEAYIPLANDGRRPRAEAIWEQTGHLLGVQFQRFAVGGFSNVPGIVGSTRGINMVDRAAESAGRSLASLAGMGMKELEIRQRLLEREVERDKRRLDMLKQEREAIASMVSSAFHTDAFGASGEGITLRGSQLPDNFAEMSPEEQAKAVELQKKMLELQYQLTQSTNLLQQQNTLSAGIAEKQEAIRLLKILRQRGLNGPAFVNLAATGDVATLRAYVEMSKADLREYERQTNQDVRLEQRLGAFAGNSEMNAAIHRQEKRLSEAVAEQRQTNKHLRELQQAVHDEGANATGKAVGREVNGAAVAGSKGR